jgi:hypothetical protein
MGKQKLGKDGQPVLTKKQRETLPMDSSSDMIFLGPAKDDLPFEVVPRVPSESNPKRIKHVVREGARFHTPIFTSRGMRCSEPDCILNLPQPQSALKGGV